MITPELAGEIIAHRNPVNRKIAQIKLAQTCSDITDGRFRVNGESIVFDRSGNLIDGQHRMMACHKTGIPIITLCAFGIDGEAQKTIDLGKLRSAGDIATLGGVAEANHVAAAARMVLAYESGDGSSLGRPSAISTSSVTAFIDRRHELIVAVSWTSRFKPTLMGICPRSVVAAARVILERAYGPAVVEYLEQFATGENINASDPAFSVRKRLWGKRVAHGIALEAIFRGAVAYMEGRSLTRVEINNRFPPLPKGRGQ
jgi:hypothetical protein